MVKNSSVLQGYCSCGFLLYQKRPGKVQALENGGKTEGVFGGEDRLWVSYLTYPILFDGFRNPKANHRLDGAKTL